MRVCVRYVSVCMFVSEYYVCVHALHVCVTVCVTVCVQVGRFRHIWTVGLVCVLVRVRVPRAIARYGVYTGAVEVFKRGCAIAKRARK